MSDLVRLHDDLWVVQRPLGFLGLELGTRMTVVRFGDELLLHSPVAPDDALRHALADLGRVRWVVGPNRFHHLFLGPWMALGAEGWAVDGLRRKRSDLAFAGTVGQGSPWPEALDAHALSSIPFTDEAVFLHRPSRTLVVSDLLFNFTADAPWLTRAAMRAGGAYPGVCCSLLERVMMKRAAARTDLERILRWDFDRVVLAHGAVVEEGGRDGRRTPGSGFSTPRDPTARPVRGSGPPGPGPGSRAARTPTASASARLPRGGDRRNKAPRDVARCCS